MKPEVRTALLLALFWAVATAPNLTKAVHVDDAAYLEIAGHILEDPLHPMSGTLNWRDSREPIYQTNQPPLLFYLYAAVLGVVGPSEIALHAVMAAWTLIAIVFFYRLARRLQTEHPLSLTALFCLGPAFLPSQNLMTDVPTVALWLVFFSCLMGRDGQGGGTGEFAVAAIAAAAACLIKYVSLVLLPILLLAALVYKAPRRLWTLAIPVGGLVAWSLFNVYDYGGVHLLARGGASFDVHVVPRRLAEWVLCLGAVSPFTLMVVPYVSTRRSNRYLPIACAVAAVALYTTSRSQWQNTPLESVLKAAFFANGILLVGIAATHLAEMIRPERNEKMPHERIRAILFTAWLIGAAGVVIGFSPGMAVRHVLTALPVLLLICAELRHSASGATAGLSGSARGTIGWAHRGTSAAMQASVAATVVSGVLFGVSDYAYAGVYRDEAPRIAAGYSRPGQTLWYVGHWGWQCYAERAGMQQYDARVSEPAPGDRIVVPRLVDKQSLAPRHAGRLRAEAGYAVPAGPWTWLRTMSIGPRGSYGLYALRIETLPWTVSRDPLEYFDVFEVR